MSRAGALRQFRELVQTGEIDGLLAAQDLLLDNQITLADASEPERSHPALLAEGAFHLPSKVGSEWWVIKRHFTDDPTGARATYIGQFNCVRPGIAIVRDDVFTLTVASRERGVDLFSSLDAARRHAAAWAWRTTILLSCGHKFDDNDMGIKETLAIIRKIPVPPQLISGRFAKAPRR